MNRQQLLNKARQAKLDAVRYRRDPNGAGLAAVRLADSKTLRAWARLGDIMSDIPFKADGPTVVWNSDRYRK